MKILIADDSMLMRAAVKKALSLWGYTDVVEAVDGGDALEKIHAHDDISIAIVDWQMPVLDGTEVCRKVREFSDSRYIYIIMLTAQAAERSVIEAMSHGADDYIVKSSKFDQLEARLHAAKRIVSLHGRLREEGERLARAQRMESVGHLAAGVGHELNTPLQYILQNTEYVESEVTALLKSLTDNKIVPPGFESKIEFLLEEVPQALKDTREGIDHARRIVSALRDFSCPAGALWGPGNINEIVQSTLTVAQHEWRYRASVESSFAADLPEIQCIPQDISRAALQLVMNAAQAVERAGRGAGTIRVLTRAAEKGVELEVSDCGIGIDPAIKDKIFDPFFRAQQSTLSMGNGLAFVYAAVVQRHKGTIAIDSVPGTGTTVRVTLPSGSC